MRKPIISLISLIAVVALTGCTATMPLAPIPNTTQTTTNTLPQGMGSADVDLTIKDGPTIYIKNGPQVIHPSFAVGKMAAAYYNFEKQIGNEAVALTFVVTYDSQFIWDTSTTDSVLMTTLNAIIAKSYTFEGSGEGQVPPLSDGSTQIYMTSNFTRAGAGDIFTRTFKGGKELVPVDCTAQPVSCMNDNLTTSENMLLGK